MKKDAFNQMNKTATKVGEVYWYNTKKLALNAAAAKALDCFSFRRCLGTDKSPWQRCIDSPYMLATDALPLPNLPSGVILPPRVPNEAIIHPPKHALAEHYISYLQKLKSAGFSLECLDNEMAPGKDSYTSWSNMDCNTPLYSAIFTCHLSGERFQSGKLNGGTYKEECMSFDKHSRMLVPCASFEEASCKSKDTIVNINVIWYTTKKEAIDAAAGRAVDCLRHRLAQHRPASDHQMYCMESPYAIDDTPKAWKSVSESALRAIGGDLWPSVPHEHRFTTLFDIRDIHALLESERDWNASYKAARYS
jgi:hypothetical protein